MTHDSQENHTVTILNAVTPACPGGSRSGVTTKPFLWPLI